MVRPDDSAPRVLIADDELDIREAMVDLLQEQGFATVEAATFDEALAELEKQDFQGVLSDFRMAGSEDPWEALRRMVELADPAPVGLLTAWPTREEEARSHGIAFLLPKPFDVSTFYARVAEHLQIAPPDAEKERRIRQYFDALSEREWDRLGALCTEDVVYHLPGSNPRFSKTIVGRAPFCEFLAETFNDFPDARSEVLLVLTLPSNSMVARYSSSWLSADGERRSVAGSVMFRFRGESIARIGVRQPLEEIAVS
jgi:CheY-like chemotaxis protein